jgi:prophage maintenance system killer protein
MIEYIGLDDFLLFAEAVLGVPAHDIYRTCDIAQARAALQAPEAGVGDYVAHPTMAEKAAALTYRLCVEQPLLFGNVKVAYVLLREFVDRNDYRWLAPDGDDPDGDETAKVLWSVVRRQCTQAELAEWISERIGGRA